MKEVATLTELNKVDFLNVREVIVLSTGTVWKYNCLSFQWENTRRVR